MDVKTRFRFKGRDYSGPDELPPEVRVAFEKAMANRTGQEKVIINGQAIAADRGTSDTARKLYDDVMAAIENNGEVTLPNSRRFEPLITKRQLRAVILVVGLLFGLAVLALVRR
jgi:hypothetical protein